MPPRRLQRAHRPRIAAAVLLVAATFVVSLGGPSEPARAATTLTFVPTADAYVVNNARTTNFGTDATLQVGSSPFYHSYLMFDVQGTSGTITSATLSLYADTGGSGSSVHSTSTGWTETGITYANAPSYGSTVATVSNFSAGATISYDVTSLVTGNGLVAFAYTSASKTNIAFASREDAAHAPQLVVVSSGGSATAPGAPTGVSAVAGNGQATVSWTAPSSDGGSAIQSYTATASPGGLTCTTSTLGCTVTGLTNGTSYTFTVTATNAIGTGPPSTASNAVTPAGLPGAPSSVSATPGNAQATVSWAAAAPNGSTIQSYTATASPGGLTCTTTSLSCTVTNLTNGTSYTFTVTATNGVGTGLASSASSPVIPATTPGAPTGVSAVAGNGQASVSWTAPSSDGGSPILSYTITGTPGGSASVTAPATSALVTGLTNGTSYTFTVTATNAIGSGSASSASNAVTPAGLPGAPTGVSAVAGNAQATVSWTAAAPNGSAILSYTVNDSGGGSITVTAPATSAVVTGLTNGQSYTFTVTATNGIGSGSPSSASNAVTPTAGPIPVLRRAPYLTNLSTTTATVNLATDTSTPAPVIGWDLASTGCTAPSHLVPATSVAAFSGALSGTTDIQFMASISGLSAGTAYCYRVTQGGYDLLGKAVTFTTAPPASSSAAFTFAVIGDWGAGSTDEANVFTQIAAANPAFLMTVGDNVYNSGTQTEYGDLNGGNAFAPAYLPKIGGGTPVFAAQGNHGFTGYSAYLQNFPQAAVAAASGGTYAPQSYCCAAGTSGTHTYASAWYAFTWGNARFYVLEAGWADGNGAYQGDFTDHWNGPVSGCTPCGQELTWLQGDLAAHASVPLKFAVFHYPLYADNGGQPSDTYLDGTGALEGLLAANGVDVVFNGHAHQYERNLPQISGEPLVSYVTGGGGDALGSISGCSAFDAYAIGSSSSCNAPKPTSSTQVFHYLKVTVNGGQVTVTPINELGQSFDVQTYTFGSGGGATAPGAPTNVTAVAGNGQASVSWTSPSSDGGSTITSYTVTGSPGGSATVTAPATSAIVTGLINGQSYTFTVTATNGVGTGPPSTASNAVIPVGLPGVPTGVTATAGNGQATVSWTAAASNGSTISSYTITGSPGGSATVSGSATSAVVSSLINGQSYTFTVTATNGVGTGPPSVPSNSVIPTAATGPFTLVPTADAYVSSGAKTTNYGTSTTLEVGSSPLLHTYIMFDVQGLTASPTSATLMLWTDSAGSGSSVHSTSTAWTETGITYSNAPSYGSTVGTVTNFAAGTWISYNVTSLVTGNGAVAFAFTSASKTPILFASREDTVHAPQLIIAP